MSSQPFCFFVMPFKSELNYFYLYLQRHLSDKHGIHVERGDHEILTKPLMEKLRAQIGEADFIIGDISHSNPNVFYELGLAHGAGKPVIFLTQHSPSDAPVDVRPFEFIQYDLAKHDDFLAKLDKAVSSVLGGSFDELYEHSLELLRSFNGETTSQYAPLAKEEFETRVRKSLQTQNLPAENDEQGRAGFLLPKILADAADVETMIKVTDWVGRIRD